MNVDLDDFLIKQLARCDTFHDFCQGSRKGENDEEICKLVNGRIENALNSLPNLSYDTLKKQFLQIISSKKDHEKTKLASLFESINKNCAFKTEILADQIRVGDYIDYCFPIVHQGKIVFDDSYFQMKIKKIAIVKNSYAYKNIVALKSINGVDIERQLSLYNSNCGQDIIHGWKLSHKNFVNAKKVKSIDILMMFHNTIFKQSVFYLKDESIRCLNISYYTVHENDPKKNKLELVVQCGDDIFYLDHKKYLKSTEGGWSFNYNWLTFSESAICFEYLKKYGIQYKQRNLGIITDHAITSHSSTSFDDTLGILHYSNLYEEEDGWFITKFVQTSKMDLTFENVSVHDTILVIFITFTEESRHKNTVQILSGIITKVHGCEINIYDGKQYHDVDILFDDGETKKHFQLHEDLFKKNTESGWVFNNKDQLDALFTNDCNGKKQISYLSKMYKTKQDNKFKDNFKYSEHFKYQDSSSEYKCILLNVKDTKTFLEHDFLDGSGKSSYEYIVLKGYMPYIDSYESGNKLALDDSIKKGIKYSKLHIEFLKDQPRNRLLPKYQTIREKYYKTCKYVFPNDYKIDLNITGTYDPTYTYTEYELVPYLYGLNMNGGWVLQEESFNTQNRGSVKGSSSYNNKVIQFITALKPEIQPNTPTYMWNNLGNLSITNIASPSKQALYNQIEIRIQKQQHDEEEFCSDDTTNDVIDLIDEFFSASPSNPNHQEMLFDADFAFLEDNFPCVYSVTHKWDSRNKYCPQITDSNIEYPIHVLNESVDNVWFKIDSTARIHFNTNDQDAEFSDGTNTYKTLKSKEDPNVGKPGYLFKSVDALREGLIGLSKFPNMIYNHNVSDVCTVNYALDIKRSGDAFMISRCKSLNIIFVTVDQLAFLEAKLKNVKCILLIQSNNAQVYHMILFNPRLQSTTKKTFSLSSPGVSHLPLPMPLIKVKIKTLYQPSRFYKSYLDVFKTAVSSMSSITNTIIKNIYTSVVGGELCNGNPLLSDKMILSSLILKKRKRQHHAGGKQQDKSNVDINVLEFLNDLEHYPNEDEYISKLLELCETSTCDFDNRGFLNEEMQYKVNLLFECIKECKDQTDKLEVIKEENVQSSLKIHPSFEKLVKRLFYLTRPILNMNKQPRLKTRPLSASTAQQRIENSNSLSSVRVRPLSANLTSSSILELNSNNRSGGKPTKKKKLKLFKHMLRKKA